MERHETDRLILQSQSASRALPDWGIMEKLLKLDEFPVHVRGKKSTRLRELVKEKTGEVFRPRNKNTKKTEAYHKLQSRNYDFSQLDDILAEERSRALNKF